jgi:hypothetical protein
MTSRLMPRAAHTLFGEFPLSAMLPPLHGYPASTPRPDLDTNPLLVSYDGITSNVFLENSSIWIIPTSQTSTTPNCLSQWMGIMTMMEVRSPVKAL